MTDRSKITSTYSRRDTLRMMALTGAAGLVAPNLLGKPAFGQTPPASPSGRIVVGLSQEPTVFNPLMTKIETDDGVHFSMFDALLRIDPEGVLQPNLAVEVPSQENGGISADGLQWRFRLRDDVRWHDGEPFTAEDVKFTLELITNPDFRAWRTTGHELVRDITVVSPTEITWRMEEAFAPYLSFLTETFIVPKHILEKEADPNAAAFNQAPVGTGAFKWGQRVAGDHIELVANPDYFGEGPYIEQLIFKYIPDVTVLYTQFKSGDIDLVGQTYITPDNYEEARNLPGRVVTLVPQGSVESIYLNLERPQFKDLAVREALYTAIDRQGDHRRALLRRAEDDRDLHAAAVLLLQPEPAGAGVQPGPRAPDARRGRLAARPGRHPRQGRRAAVLRQLDHRGQPPPRADAAVPAADVRRDRRRDDHLEPAGGGDVGRLLDAVAVRHGHGGHHLSDRRRPGLHQPLRTRVDRRARRQRLEQRAILEPRGRRAARGRRPHLRSGKAARDLLRVQEIIRHDLPFLPLFRTRWSGHKEGIQGFVPNVNTRTESWNAAAWYWAS